MKKLILLFITTVFMLACENDDYSIEYNDNEVKQDFAVSLTLSRDRVATETYVNFTVSIESALATDAVVTVANLNDCGNPLSHLAESTTGTATIKAGQTSGDGSIFASAMNAEYSGGDIAWDGISDCATFKVTGIALSEGDDPYVGSSTSVGQTITQVNADYMVDADDDAVMISMDWKNPSANDFDMFVSDAAGDFYEAAESGSRFEGAYFDSDSGSYYPAPDGVYTVWFVPYDQEAADVPAEVYFTHPVTGKVDVVSFVCPAGAPLAYTPVATITKTTDEDGDMSYEIEAY